MVLHHRSRNRGGCFWLCNAACGANEITRQASSAEVAWTDSRQIPSYIGRLSIVLLWYAGKPKPAGKSIIKAKGLSIKKHNSLIPLTNRIVSTCRITNDTSNVIKIKELDRYWHCNALTEQSHPRRTNKFWGPKNPFPWIIYSIVEYSKALGACVCSYPVSIASSP